MYQSFNMGLPTTTDSKQLVPPCEQMTKEQQAMIERYRKQKAVVDRYREQQVIRCREIRNLSIVLSNGENWNCLKCSRLRSVMDMIQSGDQL